MKKLAPLLLTLLLLFSLCACQKADTSKWAANDIFSAVPVYKYSDVSSTEFSTSMNVKIEKASYEDFVKYIGDLKKDGFEFLKVGDAPENYSLVSGTAQWRCTNGKVFLQLIFSEEGTAQREMFGCDLQIYGYNDSKYLTGEKESEKASSKKAASSVKQSTASDND